MNYDPNIHSKWADTKRRELEIREKIMKLHKEGKLPRSYYKFCKGNQGKGISPKDLMELEKFFAI